mmetsp:Transcript_38734/g.84148  ORF Transcript_38734/g.84148 Transcript_38734/m.84148 type:complete len:1283 (+) Transcript_38734:168-4016(+)
MMIGVSSGSNGSSRTGILNGSSVVLAAIFLLTNSLLLSHCPVDASSALDSVGRRRVWVGAQSLKLPDMSQTQLPKKARATSWLRERLLPPSVGGRKLLTDTPVQTYFLPIGETQMLESMDLVNAAAVSPLTSLNSIAIAADGTVVWYDHQEDGYEPDTINPAQNSTVVWGDGDKSNGCAPGTEPCTNENDVLNAGDVIILQNEVPIPRVTDDILWDGGDRIQSSFPVAITRGLYSGGDPEPGSLLGGAVEVLDTESWGTAFESPVGVGMAADLTPPPGKSFVLNSYQITEFYVMASEDDTTVTLPQGPFTVTLPNGLQESVTDTGAEFALDMGETLRVSGSLTDEPGDGIDGGIKVGDEITSDRPVQVTLVSGDEDSKYEMRWYGLLPTALWGNDYYTPVGDDLTRVYLYNPGPSSIDVFVDNVDSDALATISIAPGEYGRYDIPTEGSGYRFYTTIEDHKFYGVTQTDDKLIANEGTPGKASRGAAYDWGHPLIPATELTSKVIVGYAYGCKDPAACLNETIDEHPPSPVWLTPAADAKILIDYDSDGISDENITVGALESVLISHSEDWDMSGATITAVSSTDENIEVDIAVAWGQNPDTVLLEKFNLDMGTSVLPLPVIAAQKSCELIGDNDDDGKVSPGDELRCNIRVTNTGQKPVANLTFVETLSNFTDYVPGSTTCCDGTTIPDSPEPDSPFPLDEEGLTPVDSGLDVGDAEGISYNVIVKNLTDLPKDVDIIADTGVVIDPSTGEEVETFNTRTQFFLTPELEIVKSVAAAGTGGCHGEDPLLVEQNDEVVICYTITNTGNVNLTNVGLGDAGMGVGDPDPVALPIGTGFLAVGESVSYNSTYVVTSPGIDVLTEGTVEGTPVYPDETEITSLEDATASYLSGVIFASSVPSVSLEPSQKPSVSLQPSIAPTSRPTVSLKPSVSFQPSSNPSVSWMPSTSPSDVPSLLPSSSPSDVPSDLPSSSPSALPSSSPSDVPSSNPSVSWMPSTSPSDVPSLLPSSSPSDVPSDLPSSSPSALPSSSPSDQPSMVPSVSLMPTTSPSESPSRLPSSAPSDSPSAAPSYPKEPRTVDNTICRAYNITATESMVLRSFLFNIQTNGCIEVIVEYKRGTDTAWTTMCSAVEEPVWGQYPNATLLHSRHCTEVTIMEGETVEFRLLTAPSNECILGSNGYQIEFSNYTMMDMWYTYEQMDCPAPTAAPTSTPSFTPSAAPSGAPSGAPSSQPSGEPSSSPSLQPSSNPSTPPTAAPTPVASDAPSQDPTGTPTSPPTEFDSAGA